MLINNLRQWFIPPIEVTEPKPRTDVLHDAETKSLSEAPRDEIPNPSSEVLRRDLAVVFIFSLSAVAFSILLWLTLGAIGIDIPPWMSSRVLEVLAVSLCLIAFRKTSLRPWELGIWVPRERLWGKIRPALLLSAGFLAGMIGMKLLLNRFGVLLGEGRDFFYWDPVYGKFTYILAVPFQEVVLRSLQVSLRRALPLRRRALHAIWISGVLFCLMHISYGLRYMLMTGLACLVLGLFYEKSKSFWGCCVLHYFFGIAFKVLSFQP